MKTALVAALFASVATIGVPAAAGGPSPSAATSFFVVRPDPRECPSPACGGYWVSLANHARTRCADGLLRPRCYAAEATAAGTRQPTSPGDALVRGTLESDDFGGLGRLGVLVVAGSWAPVGATPATGTFVRIRDTGIRCVRAPCFSMRATRLNTDSAAIRVSAVSFGRLAGPRVDMALRSTEGLLAAGRFEPTGNGGRLFRASQVYLRSSPPRA